MYIIITHYCKLIRGQVNQFSIICSYLLKFWLCWWTI